MKEYRVKPHQNGKTLELLRDIDAALARMEAKGHAETIHYARLKAKRDAIASGEPYATYNITPYLIRAMGAQVPNVNFGKDGKLIKPQGDWRKHVAPAGRFVNK